MYSGRRFRQCLSCFKLGSRQQWRSFICNLPLVPPSVPHSDRSQGEDEDSSYERRSSSHAGQDISEVSNVLGVAGDVLDQHNEAAVGQFIGERHDAVHEGGGLCVLGDEFGDEGEAGNHQDGARHSHEGGDAVNSGLLVQLAVSVVNDDGGDQAEDSTEEVGQLAPGNSVERFHHERDLCEELCTESAEIGFCS